MAKWEEIAPLLDNNDTRAVLIDSPALLLGSYAAALEERSFVTDGYTSLPLAIEEEGEKIIPASLYAMIVNPASENKREAVDFLTFYAQNLPAPQRIAMCPGENTPVEDPQSRQTAAELEQAIHALSEQLDTCAPEKKKQLDEQLALYRQDLAFYQNNRWIISPDEIEAYRLIAGALTFGRLDIGFDSTDRQMRELIQSFNSRGIDSARFCDAFLAIWDMALREE